MSCIDCGGEMKLLFSSFYCSNECNKKATNFKSDVEPYLICFTSGVTRGFHGVVSIMVADKSDGFDQKIKIIGDYDIELLPFYRGRQFTHRISPGQKGYNIEILETY